MDNYFFILWSCIAFHFAFLCEFQFRSEIQLTHSRSDESSFWQKKVNKKSSIDIWRVWKKKESWKLIFTGKRRNWRSQRKVISISRKTNNFEAAKISKLRARRKWNIDWTVVSSLQSTKRFHFKRFHILFFGEKQNGFLLPIQVANSSSEGGQQVDLLQVGRPLQVEESLKRQVRLQLAGRRTQTFDESSQVLQEQKIRQIVVAVSVS